MRSRPKKKKKIKIALTTGDVDGIGFEVTAKALLKLRPESAFTYFLFRSSNATPSALIKRLHRSFNTVIVSSLEEALFIPTSPELVDIVSDLQPPRWVEQASIYCLKGSLDGLATAPMSKELIHACGMKERGHTEIFSRILNNPNIFMGFIGSNFNVSLITDHIPMDSVSRTLTAERVLKALHHTNNFRRFLPKLEKKPLALLGLNPHAGESGLIGQEELTALKKAVDMARKESIPVIGPLTPDTAFLKKNWGLYSFYVCCYHDQGLIPFKLVHGQDEGVHISLGLPFVRTSVDHGTAKDIFGKNLANPHSMINAIQWCQKLTKSKGA